MRRFIDEYFEPPEQQWLKPTYESIKADILEQHENEFKIEEIVEYLQERYYLFRDDAETEHITSVVIQILNNMPVKNRFTGIKFI